MQSFRNLSKIESKITELLQNWQTAGKIHDFFLVDLEKIVITPKVRIKCMYGCQSYGKMKKCPPTDTLSPEECQKYLISYRKAVIMRFSPERDQTPPPNNQALLLELEREIFLADFPFALAIFPHHCVMCNDCKLDQPCKNPMKSRPSISSLCIDILGTLQGLGITQQILEDKTPKKEWYYIGMVLID